MADEVWRERFERRLARVLTDPQVRAAMPLAEVSERLREPGLALSQVVATIIDGYADRPALAQRASEPTRDESGRTVRRPLSEYTTITYRELGERLGALAAWYHDVGLRPGDFVATLGFTSGDYAVVDLAGVHLGLVTVPLQATASVAQWSSILAETEPRLLATTPDLLDAAITAIAGTAVRQLLVFDHYGDDEGHRAALESARRRLADGPVAVTTLDRALRRGQALPRVDPYVPEPGDDPLSLLIYTSGSTGAPKGAMYTERLAAAMWLYALEIPIPGLTFHYLPLSHVAGRLILGGTLARGGTAHFAASSDMSTVLEDLALARPTELLLVPRVSELVHQRFQAEVGRRVAAGEDRVAAEEAVKDELRHRVFGGRYFGVLSASAPISAELKRFMESVLEVELHDGYGSTEAGGGLIVDNRLRRPPVLDHRLDDVPELGYFRTDKPYPRGELLLKTTTMFPGYYKRPELTAEMFDADGFYRTGDVVAEIGPDQVVLVDRRNNVLKLAQGEFVTVARLEALYGTSPLIRQIFVHGSSERSYLLAVIVPTGEALTRPEPELLAALAHSLREIARAAELNSYEIPRDFLLETEPFSQDNGLLSGIGKPLRPKLNERYGQRLEQRYRELDRQRDDELRALREGAADRPVLETVMRAARALLGAAAEPGSQFTELGGDSLSALSFSTLLGEMFRVEVPVGVIVGPAMDLRGLADYIEGQRGGAGSRPSVRSVHGDGTCLRATDLRLDRFLAADLLAAAAQPPPAPHPPRTVLLTGANGYLGRFLCLEWLRRLHDSGGTLICVVRGGDAAAARARLDAAFDGADPELSRRYRELAAGTLQVLAGDIGAANLGLAEREWRRLAEGVDLIVHPAALVNHVLPYEQLFGPNVVGTAEIIRLALTARRKPVTYLSTVAVADQISPEKFTEDGDIRVLSPERVLDGRYANGYGNSKWAGEVLLREAHELCGLPVAVFRSDMILAHSRFAGQVNVADMFTRLVLSLLATGVAPRSFYSGDGARAHYDGLPADFTAVAVTELGARVTTGFQTYDVLNPHDDGISLDTFVDWLIAAGQAIERIDDYQQWLSRFETALRALPERQRRHSLLPLLHAYRRPAPPIPGALLPAERFRIAVRQAGIGSGGDIPRITPELIGKYVSDLRSRGLL
ncbi:thioester reductase domain-containing protein [Nocardia sp. CDC159]|uniref:Carboxylic acid reductase n=1 Tax=Nocardia pulmonis TaxID=2951408 RepID=A0A9X2E4R0_9NOCA|nr:MULTISPECIES: carboxylic acid reductase [Nocardia]MCM6773586.1 thioester reductase domain-containing protein [Nocardia pulmonis]MCM6786473.1 thioester reductase domain-containing protein [Nocardia sp. CDC159]